MKLFQMMDEQTDLTVHRLRLPSQTEFQTQINPNESPGNCSNLPASIDDNSRPFITSTLIEWNLLAQDTLLARISRMR